MVRGGFVWLSAVFSFALFSKFAPLTLANLEKGYFALFVRNSAMQIIGSGQIVTDVTSVIPTLLSCIALLIFSFCFSFYCFACSVRLRWGISLLRERPRALPFGFPQAFEKA